MKLAACLLLVACSTPAKKAEPVANTPSSPPPAKPAVPEALVGTCRKAPEVAGVDAGHQPEAIAHCPDPLEMSRGDGIDLSTGAPKLASGDVPPWDAAAMRDYACAYACAAPNAKAYLLGWSAKEDSRPLRNHYAAYLVEDGARWTLVSMYQHSFNTWWNIVTGFHTRARAITVFDKRPTTADVEAALDQSGFPFKGDSMFALIAGGIPAPAWTAAIGQVTTRKLEK